MVNWIVDELLGEKREATGFPSIADAAEELGHKVYRTKYVPFSEQVEDIYIGDEVVITYGTVQFCRQIEKKYGRTWTPCMYFNQNVKLWQKFAVHLADDLLNDEFVILPLATAVRNTPFNYFVKPLSGLKEFTGQIINFSNHNFEDIAKQLCPHGVIEPDVLCVLARPKEIKAEFRYVIVNKQVITGSEYRWDNVLDVRRDTHPICDAMADKVAKAEWQADTVYVCDVALLPDDTAKVVELNAFSSSGLYACDTYKIVEAVSKAAAKEWAGELEDA